MCLSVDFLFEGVVGLAGKGYWLGNNEDNRKES